MNRLIAVSAVLQLVLGACGGSASPSAAPAPIAQATTTAPLMPTPSTPAATPSPSPSPSPTPVGQVVAVGSDVEADRLFTGLPSADIAASLKTATVESYKMPFPFDPHGVKFAVSMRSVSDGKGGTFNILVVKISDGTTVVKTNSAFQASLFGPMDAAGENHWVIVPVSTSAGAAPIGVFMEAKQGVELLIADPKPSNFYPGVGQEIFKLSASSPTIEKYWAGNGHLVLSGTRTPFISGPSITADIFMRGADGKIVYMK